jgi:hypothetical protein
VVVGVVGAGHLPGMSLSLLFLSWFLTFFSLSLVGIRAQWGQPVDLKALMSVPTAKSSKFRGRLIRVLVLAVVVVFFAWVAVVMLRR